MQWQIVLAVAAGGALGALGRLFCVAALRPMAGGFPLGTLAVNVIGCLLFGLLFALLQGSAGKAFSALVFVGFLGAFTTFSTFAFDCVQLFEQGRAAAAVWNVFLHNALSLLGLLSGLWLGRQL